MLDRQPAPAPAGGGLSRLRLVLAYDGSGFSGWAAQPRLRTVQGVLTDALQRVLRGVRPPVIVAGRTDAGVHALGQVCHVDVVPAGAPESGSRICGRLNAVLPADVRIRSADWVSGEFHARWSAAWRRYQYLISDSGLLDPRARTAVWVLRRELDTAQMSDAAALLCGEHDFAAFCRPRPGASTVRTLRRLTVCRLADARDPELMQIEAEADAFCHSMVRSLVGALVAVGAGRLAGSDMDRLLAARRRLPEFTVAPAHGLALLEVGYPPESEWAVQARRSQRFRGVADQAAPAQSSKGAGRP